VKPGHLPHMLRAQGRFCAELGSPMYGELLELVARDVESGGVFATVLAGHENDRSRDAVPLRLLSALHRLVLDGRAPALRRWYPSTGGVWGAEAAWPEIVRAAAGHVAALRAGLQRPPQTNEVGRSAALIGGLLCLNHELGWPIRLFEIGTSAGLNLRADRYRYRFAGRQWGPPDAPVTIDDAWRGRLPPEGALDVVERHGYDIAPIDVGGTDGETTLLSYVWPDQGARLDRLRGAIAVAREVPARLERRTAADAVAGLTPADGALTVLWHSIVWQYLGDDERRAVREGVSALAGRAGDRSPFAHLTMEPARDWSGSGFRFLVRARRWPGGRLAVLGQCPPHGVPVTWH